VAALPPVTVLFASLLGYNPVQSLLGPTVLTQLSPGDVAYLTGRSFFPGLISGPFAGGLAVAFGFAIVACLIAGIASALRGGTYVHREPLAGQTAVPEKAPTGRRAAVADEPMIQWQQSIRSRSEFP
jgi:hypothetical protein